MPVMWNNIIILKDSIGFQPIIKYTAHLPSHRSERNRGNANTRTCTNPTSRDPPITCAPARPLPFPETVATHLPSQTMSQALSLGSHPRFRLALLARARANGYREPQSPLSSRVLRGQVVGAAGRHTPSACDRLQVPELRYACFPLTHPEPVRPHRRRWVRQWSWALGAGWRGVRQRVWGVGWGTRRVSRCEGQVRQGGGEQAPRRSGSRRRSQSVFGSSTGYV